MLDFSKPLELPTEGTRGFHALCGLARHLGYKDPMYSMQNSDGSTISDLMLFLQDNPGAIQAVFEWVNKNHPQDDDEALGGFMVAYDEQEE